MKSVHRNILVITISILLLIGFFLPKAVSYQHLKTERGQFEVGQIATLMEDWRIINPCLPYRYTNIDAPSCPQGEDQKVVESICWFGIPGPKLRICYKNAQTTELGTQKPVIVPR